MKITPILSEKSLTLAKGGKYSFWVDSKFGKHAIKKIIGKTFGVDVKSVKTLNFQKRIRKNYLGKKITKSAAKKAVIEIGEKQEIDIFKESIKESKGK
ncbi:MAG: hypothetical protein ACD_52C00176G0002 [uncultured bacterium]|uniref:50S ribosomal protein L23 n=1 Tax=Candidatus Woesebacteria bacterium RIFCSPHIGHO2_12_FULL_41_24 TaxID=1802510 RepID=A0A1F8APJ2_9BACT|nr:MAG: hypothetical protein ACD_52C00176G0002 [uncultured bacterium]OGM13979.1 MAG: 50S ribosomal protein L23 [Candidatus Woesebacteria bacterium RBG_16_41_13]OGM29237.1 MAG: 50S ribosomal protein L23 [Candidatus Woesebacteria bacterium RIFCSPHIGHO2_01_FULL_42_80]OGM34735.1 MAG: 50S ribosomal protein L23 [Candidatus Woesebacteria bacterium RIFCSPHIGHO2_02_FULL_42_20]OGM53676.1 MAG: 50S ribosomal protein L23 [Candidatus Woesebacteria bacterium RIFCSPHIGHO2_12_FULL_41_24]OGM67034.1 MAG: 50S rib